jgi:hypothetical protein
MKGIIMLAVAVALAGTQGGCAGLAYPASQSTMGWSFYVGRPSTLTIPTSTVLNQTNGPVGIQPTGALAGTSPSVIHTPPPMAPAASTTGRQLFVTPCCPAECPNGCSPAEMCERLNRLEKAATLPREE